MEAVAAEAVEGQAREAQRSESSPAFWIVAGRFSEWWAARAPVASTVLSESALEPELVAEAVEAAAAPVQVRPVGAE